MKKRFKLARGKSRRLFRKGVSRTHKFNVNSRPMRGGVRL